VAGATVPEIELSPRLLLSRRPDGLGHRTEDDEDAAGKGSPNRRTVPHTHLRLPLVATTPPGRQEAGDAQQVAEEDGYLTDVVHEVDFADRTEQLISGGVKQLLFRSGAREKMLRGATARARS
jgi:hypothetical protein